MRRAGRGFQNVTWMPFAAEYHSVLAKRYSDFAPEKLKEIYESSKFEILN